MSDIDKEWREVLREYMERQQVDPYTYHPDRLTEERKRLDKEYFLNQLCNIVTQQETDNDK